MPPPGPAIMLVRPEALRLTPPEPGAMPATITGRRFVGPAAVFTARTDGGAVLEVVGPTAGRARGRAGRAHAQPAGGRRHPPVPAGRAR